LDKEQTMKRAGGKASGERFLRMMVDGKDELSDDTRRDLQYNTNQTNKESEENQDGDRCV